MEELIKQLYQTYQQSGKVTTDSRAITPGCIFFAFKGETFDGNAFASQALAQGAALCVIDNPQYKCDERCIVVDDVLATLQQLAHYHRTQLSIPIIGITGTNGKTTTKELVHAVLKKKYRTSATVGNHNNHLGVPLTLLEIGKESQIAIVEMGANHPGEIAQLCQIADPDFGLITNVGKAHLEGFGGFEGVIATKTELYRHLSTKDGTAFVNGDNDILLNHSHLLRKVVTYGKSNTVQVKGNYVGSNPYMKFYIEDGDNVYTIQTQLMGGYNFDNAMAAVCVGRYFGVDLFDIKEALQEYQPTNNRSQFKQTDHNSLIMDCYNANPSSMKVALENFGALQATNKIAMLGGMKELGPDSLLLHTEVLNQALSLHLQKIILVGEEWGPISNPQVLQFSTSQHAKDYLTQQPISNATILIKGSNGTKMWILSEIL